MGIYLPNMEMPKGLEMLVVFSDGTVHKCLPGMREYVEKGTAVPVPPHGRTICADALMREMHNVILEDGEDRRTFYSVIERQPTIIPADPEEEEMK